MVDKYIVGLFFLASLFLFVAHVDAEPIEQIGDLLEETVRLINKEG